MRGLAALVIGSLAAACSSEQSKIDRDRAIAVGTVLSARGEHDEPLTLRIDAIARDTDPEVVMYEVSFRDPDGGWHRYCEPDREGKQLAIPLQGGWRADGTHVANDSLTFACTNGALGKCVRWGYKPWSTFKGQSLAPYHQACVHLVIADYCGVGKAHTRNGTPIDIWDHIGIQKRVTSPGQVFEAAWSTSGAAYVNKPRLTYKLPDIVAECPDRLAGRTSLDAPSMTDAEVSARWPEALLFTESYVGEPPSP